MLNFSRYKRVPVVDFPQRQWPNKQIEKAPIWCSVDLRDGNQALIEPMTVEEKVETFIEIVADSTGQMKDAMGLAVEEVKEVVEVTKEEMKEIVEKAKDDLK